MFDQFQLIQLFKVETINPTTHLKSTTTGKRVATRRLRNAALECHILFEWLLRTIKIQNTDSPHNPRIWLQWPVKCLYFFPLLSAYLACPF